MDFLSLSILAISAAIFFLSFCISFAVATFSCFSFSCSALIFVFSTLMIYFSFRNYKLFVSKKFIIQNEGAWDVDSSIILPSKIQAITTQQFFWQKRTNIGSVNLSTAGGNINFTTGNYSEIKELVNYWLFQVENSNKNWM
jgi:putative membrane protein